MIDYIIRTNAHHPHMLAIRGPGSRVGYLTREDAETRASAVRCHMAAQGDGGVTLDVIERDRLAERCDAEAYRDDDTHEYVLPHGCVLLPCGNAASSGIQASELRSRYPRLFSPAA